MLIEAFLKKNLRPQGHDGNSWDGLYKLVKNDEQQTYPMWHIFGAEKLCHWGKMSHSGYVSEMTYVSQNCVTSGKFNAIYPEVTHFAAQTCVTVGKIPLNLK